MEKSLFVKYVDKWFEPFVTGVVNKLNDAERQPTYLHRQFLTKQYSVDGKWESLVSNNSIVAADVVAMDSSLPLKTRDAIYVASGDIPKMGMEMKLNENQLTAIDSLVARNNPQLEQRIVSLLFQDTPKVIAGIYERNEAIFLQALSSGVALVDANNNGTGIRVDYGFLPENKFLTQGDIWSTTATATPISDFEKVFEKASKDGKTITKIMMDFNSWNNFKKTSEVKGLYASNIGFTGANIPTPTLNQINEALSANYSVTIEVVDRSVFTEKNGVRTSYKPWQANSVAFLTSNDLGSIVWAELAEANHKVAGVTYQTADEYILVSKFSTNRPSLGEFTLSQSRVLPVLSDVSGVYLLDTATKQG